MRDYDHKAIEEKWKKRWEANPTVARDDEDNKTYLLVEFPFPSGEGLHVGHVRGYTAMDILARKRRRQGENVLYPIGWDAFGLPTENYAIKVGRDPRDVTKENTDNFRSQMKSLGLSFDWSREVDTTDPAYYKWTQWIFLKLYEKGLAYKDSTTINWCPKDKIGLANEEVVNGMCERCGTAVEKREREQWMLKITEYAQRLYDDLDTVNYIERAKAGQRNWIGPSEGAEIKFQITNSKSQKNAEVAVFTTRPDTLFGATYVVLAPEHPLLQELSSSISNWSDVEAYIADAKKKDDIARTDETKEKTGVKLEGVTAINPANQETIPVFVADYVLGSYGTGAVMAVPAHDERDWEFAKKFDLPVKYVVAPYFVDTTENSKTRPGVAVTNRSVGVGIVKHWSENKYLMLDWKNGWTSFITGGIEEGELHSDAMLREIQEETGYRNVRFIKDLGGPEIADFYGPHKGKNQHVIGYGMYFELIDGEQEGIPEEELAKHEPMWVHEDEVVRFLDKGAPMGDSRYSELFWKRLQTGSYVWTGEGLLINSEGFHELTTQDARKKITEHVGGRWVTKFKLRDWVFSRQRYWGEPIPMVKCDSCGWVPLPESELPLTLPQVDKYEPTETGDSPLAKIDEWVNTTCPQCSAPAKRETDVMPNWAGSSWYYLRYCDPHNDTTLADKTKLEAWLPVDWYNGGMEHTTLHLLYSRFWHKFLYDIGVVPTTEPYIKRTSHGLILAEGGEKMSKSKGNVVNPDDVNAQFGADTLRVYEMFMGPFDQAIAWSTDGLVGVRRFLERVVKLKNRVGENVVDGEDVEVAIHQAIKKVGDDIEEFRFNTAVSQMMILVNALDDAETISRQAYETLVLLLAPFAPFITEELWEGLGHAESVHGAPWPVFDPSKLVGSEVTIAVQINGKVRGTVTCPPGTPEATVLALAREDEKTGPWTEKGPISKVFFVPDKLINIIVDLS